MTPVNRASGFVSNHHAEFFQNQRYPTFLRNVFIDLA